MGVARKRGHERVVSAPAGGYDLEGLARSVDAHVTALMEG
jgi:acetoin utilization deacetylase AcuC-like enzyme